MNYYEGDNIGSIANIDVINHFDIDSFNPLVSKESKTWLSIPLKEESGVLFLKISDSDNGSVYAFSGRFFLHHIRDEVEADLYPFLGQFAVMRLTDMNGRVYILGAPGLPVTLELSGSTGQRYADENGQEFQFKIEQSFNYVMI